MFDLKINVSLCDPMFDLKINAGNVTVTYISDPVILPYILKTLMYEHHTLGLWYVWPDSWP